MPTSPYEILREAIKAVPAVKFALGIAGILAVLAIARGFSLSYRVAVFGTVLMLVLMTVLVVFARLSTAGPSFFYGPAVVLTWFSVTVVIATAGFLFSSIFFQRPVDLRRWLDPSLQSDVTGNPIVSLGQRISRRSSDGEVLQAIRALLQYAETLHSQQSTDLAVQQLKDVLVRQERASRPVTKALLEAIKKLRNSNLHTEFSHGELEGRDLVNVDLSNTDLRDVKFDGAFMIETDVRGADLGGSSFSKAWIRNMKFAGAKMYGTDMTDADWFNASGLSFDQIDNVKKGTVRPCPTDRGEFNEQAFQAFLSAHYGFPFDSWSEDVKTELRNAWQEYIKPGGLCQRVRDEMRHAQRADGPDAK
jgi:hypothetical protein